MGKRSRDKGKRGERRWRTWLQRWWPGAHRGTQSDGARYCDVEGTPLWLECKARARLDLLGAMRQAEQDTDGRPAVVLASRVRKGPGRDEYVVMRPDTLARILDELLLHGSEIDVPVYRRDTGERVELPEPMVPRRGGGESAV